MRDATKLVLAVAVATTLAAHCTAQVRRDPKTGHYFERVEANLDWFESDAAARRRRYRGLLGRLAVVTTASEWETVLDVLGGSTARRSYWLGGFQRAGGAETSRGWSWIGGEPWRFSAWHVGQPNDRGDQDGLAATRVDGRWAWADRDQSADFSGYVVEYAPAMRTAVGRSHHPTRNSDQVFLQAGDLRVYFDTWFGGTPMRVDQQTDQGTRQLIWDHAGGALNTVYETGQDATQSSPNGLTPFPLSRLSNPSAYYSYYARERVLRGPTGLDPTAEYVVEGHFPFFWLSHEPRDDAIAGIDSPRATDWASKRTSWFLNYTTAPAQRGSRSFTSHGVPIWFDVAAGGPQSGLLFLGNETIWDPNDPVRWSERMCEIPEGRFACSVRVSLARAAPDAIAGIFFRRTVPTGANQDAAFRSQGYACYVNQQGVVQIVKSDGRSSHVVWNRLGQAFASRTIGSSFGARIELRTHNGRPGEIQVLVDRQRVGTYVDQAPHRGPHFGLFAQTSRGSISFRDRTVCDVGLEMRARWVATEDGSLVSEHEVKPALGAEGVMHDFHSLSGLHVFMNRPQVPELNAASILDRSSRLVPVSGSQRNPIVNNGDLLRRVLAAAPEEAAHPSFSLYLGVAPFDSIRKGPGIFVTPQSATIDGKHAGRAHTYVAALREPPANQPPLLFMGFSPFRYGFVPRRRPRPVRAAGYRHVVSWSTTAPTHRAARVKGVASGCRSAAGQEIVHSTRGAPRVGRVAEMQLSDAPRSTLAVLVVGVRERLLKIGPCSLWPEWSLLVPAVTNSSGGIVLPLPIGANDRLVGSRLWSQFLVLEGRTVVASRALRITLGR